MKKIQALKQIAINNEVKQIESDIIYILTRNSIKYSFVHYEKILDNITGIIRYKIIEEGIVNIKEVKQILEEAGYNCIINGNNLEISFTLES